MLVQQSLEIQTVSQLVKKRRTKKKKYSDQMMMNKRTLRIMSKVSADKPQVKIKIAKNLRYEKARVQFIKIRKTPLTINNT